MGEIVALKVQEANCLNKGVWEHLRGTTGEAPFVAFGDSVLKRVKGLVNECVQHPPRFSGAVGDCRALPQLPAPRERNAEPREGIRWHAVPERDVKLRVHDLVISRWHRISSERDRPGWLRYQGQDLISESEAWPSGASSGIKLQRLTQESHHRRVHRLSAVRLRSPLSTAECRGDHRGRDEYQEESLHSLADAP